MRIPGRPNSNCMLKLCLDRRLGTLTFQIHFETASSVKGIYCCRKVPSMQAKHQKAVRKKEGKEGGPEGKKEGKTGREEGRQGGMGERKEERKGGRGGRSTHWRVRTPN